MRILSSAPPGGASDVVARLLADGFQAGFGQRFVAAGGHGPAQRRSAVFAGSEGGG